MEDNTGQQVFSSLQSQLEPAEEGEEEGMERKNIGGVEMSHMPSSCREEGGPTVGGDRVSGRIHMVPTSADSAAVDQLRTRICHLEELLAGKDAVVLALTHELDAVREMSCIDASIGPLPPGYDADFKASIAENNRKLQELSAALCQRDEMIQKLADSLKQSVRDREELKKSASNLTQQVHVLQKQLHSVGQHMQQPQAKLLEVLKEKETELHKKSTELSETKAQSSEEVRFLMSSLEELQQRMAKNTTMNSQYGQNAVKSKTKHSKELEDLRLAHATEVKYLKTQVIEGHTRESQLKAQLKAAVAQCEKLSLDLSSLKLAHEAQLSASRDYLQMFGTAGMEGETMTARNSKANIIVSDQSQAAQQKLVEEKNRVSALETEIQSLRFQLCEANKICSSQKDQIRLLENQAKEYVTNISTCHCTLEQYKKKIDEMHVKLTDDWAQKDASHQSEVVLLNGRISELQDAHARQLNVFHQDLNRMKQKQMEDLAMVQLSHENEINTCKREAERYRTELREKTNQMALLEQQLDEEKQWSRTYSQQAQELGGKLTKEEYKNEEYRKKMELMEQQLNKKDQACVLHQPQIEFLHQQLKDERQKSTNILQQLEDVRRQLLHEQERLKAYGKSMSALQLNLNNEQQHNASLKSDISTLGEQLKHERNRADSYKAEIEAFNSKVKNYLSLEKNLQDVQWLLTEEKKLSAKLKDEVGALNQQLISQKSKCSELFSQLQESQSLVEGYKQKITELNYESTNLQHAHQKECCITEKQNSEVLQSESLRASSESQDTQNAGESKMSCEKCQEKISSLESKVKLLSETNVYLKKTTEDSEIELDRLKAVFASSKDEFEIMSNRLQRELSERENEVLKLQKQRDEILTQKNEINSFNHQVKELQSAKVVLENEFAQAKEKYCKEIGELKDQLATLEEKMKACMKTVDGDTVEALVKKCRNDIVFLRSMCFSNDLPAEQNLSENIPGKRLSKTPDQLLFARPGSTPGLSSLEKLLVLCETFFNDPLEDCKITSAGHLNLDSENAKKLKNCMQAEREELLVKNEALCKETKRLQSEVEPLKMCESTLAHSSSSSTNIPDFSKLVSCWMERCEYLEQSNGGLLNNVCELQAKLSEAEKQVSNHMLSLKKLNSDVGKEKCSCEKKFSEERNSLQHTIDNLRLELEEKESCHKEKLRCLLRKQRSCSQGDLNCDENFVNIINDFSVKAKDTILLKHELKTARLEHQRISCEKQQLAELLTKTSSSLEDSWRECSTIEVDMQNALKENSILRARLMRLETFTASIKQKKISTDLMWKLIQDLADKNTKSDVLVSVEDDENKLSVFDKIDSSLKIITKISTDCELLLAKLQRDGDKDTLCGYFQSEALGLRRLHAALVEMKQIITKKSKPASQFHVDVLQQHLAEEQVKYHDICNAHFSLEAEMREMEERFQQQEEHIQGQVRKQKAAARYWQMKAEALHAEVTALQVLKHNYSPSLSNIFAEIESICSQAVSAMHSEVERVSCLRESKVRLEMSSKLIAAESNHKEQIEKVTKNLQLGSSVEVLQILHQQEINAVRAECNYAHFKDVLRLQEQMQSHFTHPFLEKMSISCYQLSLLLVKYNLSSQYNAALRKVALSLPEELLQKLSSLDKELESASLNEDSGLNFVPILDDETCLSSLEQLTSKTEEMGKKLLDMQTEKLQFVLSLCEEKHKLIVEQLQSMSDKFNTLCDARHLQEELLKAKEDHRLALASINARHKAEESRLRLLLSEQDVTVSSEPTETAMSLLRRELEEKHKRQMEELRTYFEQKCADFEKHYSEEVFSQHSRKLSDCSSASESEFVSEMYYAGPGSSTCNGPGGPSHKCDSLGESSFKEFDEHVQSIGTEKLALENREQIETMRLALESRYQGELEAQKELYEARFEELLRSMSESHIAELKLQSRRLQDMQDVENELKKKLSEAEEELSVLKQQLESMNQTEAKDTSWRKIQRKDKSDLVDQGSPDNQPIERRINYQDKEWSESELTTELQRMVDTLKQKDSESSTQIASLKSELRQNYEITTKLEKEISNLKSKYDSDLQSITTAYKKKLDEIKEMNEKISQLSSSLEESKRLSNQLKLEMVGKCMNPQKECEEKLKKKDADLADLHISLKKTTEDQKVILEAEYSEYLEFVKKCADDTKLQLIQQHENEVKELHKKHSKELAELKCSQIDVTNEGIQQKHNPSEAANTILSILSKDSFFKESSLSSSLKALLQLCGKVQKEYQQQLEAVIVKICEDITLWQEKLHSEQEMRLENVQKECERRLHLQLEEARADIVQALESHIQQLLDETVDGMEKPPELQLLEKKFTAKYQLQLKEMQKAHETQVSELCSKHAKQLSLVRSKSQSSLITPEELNNLHKERDCLRNVAATLRDVVAELVRYFVSWEDELNNTLMDELVKLEAVKESDMFSISQGEDNNQVEQTQCEKDSTHSEDEIPLIVATPASGRRASSSVKRVHFAPDISEILSFLDDGSLLENSGLNCSIRDASLNFQEELDRCLARLRSDSAALYALSKPALPNSSSMHEYASVAKEVKDQLSKDTSENLINIDQLRSENEELRSQLDELHQQYKISLTELEAAHMRLQSLEREAYERADVVAEGFGEGEQSLRSDAPNSPRAKTVEELQHKARSLLLGTCSTVNISGVVSPNSGQHLSLVVEELCRDWEQMAEESRHKQDDLQQQVEVADKQLRATRTFMDEQASEREQERDDFVREIQRLQELLRDKDRDRSTHQQMNHEVESLESQLKETQSILHDTREKLEKLNTEQKQAVEKIWTLRDIISDLEVQVATKAEEAATVLAQNEALQQMLEQQGRTQLELAQEMEELQQCSGNGKLLEQITHLEEQLRKHQLHAEQFEGPTTIEQMQSQLRDLSMSLELHTKELECANASSMQPASPCLSSPSEDVSIRETLEAMRAATGDRQAPQDALSSLSLPLKEVTQVLEQWQRHSRADDAVLKKIRDLDMQLEDVLAEKDVFVSRLQEQMLLSSSLQAKFDEHRRKSDVKLSQATAQMQSQIEDLKNELHNYAETLAVRERQIATLKSSLRQAETNLRRQGTELRESTEAERNMVAQLKCQVSKLSADKDKLQAMLSERNDMHVSLPSLVESMLIDKNADIDRLEQQVLQLSRQIDVSSHYVATPSTTLDFQYCELDKVCAHVELSPVLELTRNSKKALIDDSNYERSNDQSSEPLIHQMLPQTMSPDFKQDTEISTKAMEETLSDPEPNENAFVLSDSQSSFTETQNTQSLSECERKLTSLEQELESKNKELANYIKELDEKSVIISDLQSKCEGLEDIKLQLTNMSKLQEELTEVKKELDGAISSNLSAQKDFEMNLEKKEAEIQMLKNEISATQSAPSNAEGDDSQQSMKSSNHVMQLQAKESEIQSLREEICATQTILGNLQRKVQEAKQIARSPNRSSPDNNQALRVVQSDLEAAKLEIVELKNLCETIRAEVEKEYELKQAEFNMMLEREQQAKESLQKTFDLMLQEKMTLAVRDLENQLEEANCHIKEKETQNQKLMLEINQLNMECVALKHQLGTPINEVSSLASKLDAEKRFSATLKEELLIFKDKASSLDAECQDLKKNLKLLQKQINDKSNADHKTEENNTLLKEISDLKASIARLQREQSDDKSLIEKLLHGNVVLKEENIEVGRELTDMKKVIVQMHSVNAARDEALKCLQSKTKDFDDVKAHFDVLSDELSSLRKALKNFGAIHDVEGLAKEDIHTLTELQKLMPNLKGAGDGPWNRLSFSETDIHEISPADSQLAESESLDDLTGMVRHELNVSQQLDQSLLQTLDPLKNRKLTMNPDCSKSEQNAATVGKSNSGLFYEENVDADIHDNRLSEEKAQHKLMSHSDELRNLKASVQLLHNQLEAERIRYYALQQEDCALIEEMRRKLSAALDGQASLRLELQSQLNKQQSSMNDLKDIHDTPYPSKNIMPSASSELIDQLQLQLNEVASELQRSKVEKDAAEKQLRRLQEVEIQRSRRRAVTEEKHRRRIDQLQALQTETQQECLILRQELAAVNQRLLSANEDQAKDKDAQLKSHTPFVERLKSMNTFLEENIEENVRMAKQMEDLTNEHRKLRGRIAQLEQQLEDKQNSDNLETISARFAAERAEWAAERRVLLHSLNDAKQKQTFSSDSNVEERVSHIFGRYLRMQSYRKALVWQKRYLLSVISGLNESKSLTSLHLASFPGNSKRTEEKQPKCCRKFRSVVMAMIAIHRMQFMVERWLRGKRIGCSVVVQQTSSQYTYSSSFFPPGQQPTFSTNHSSVPMHELRGALSQSPPTLERPRQTRAHPQLSSSSQYSRFSQNHRGQETSHDLSETVTNFHLVQQRFDALLSNPPK